uniref:Uncharacterized protein n=1 Tax=Gloeothece verrucosa (strain PCC 7822) TaxID=497965 RepID=E0UBW6_GLOV7|nr:conserved hypothetical protein [Gloeothece verrucosa PCC 7822]
MTLIDSHLFNLFANSLGTILFIGFVIWAFWFASKMD